MRLTVTGMYCPMFELHITQFCARITYCILCIELLSNTHNNIGNGILEVK